MITSISNPQMRQIQNLAGKARTRRQEAQFLVEGIRMFQEIPREQLVKAYASESFARKPEHKKLLENIPWEMVSDEVLNRIADTRTPQGILAVVWQNAWTCKDLVPKEKSALILALETVQDPGNVGTIIRTAEGAGATGILINSSTADIYNPKVVRSTMGSIFRVPVVESQDFQQDLNFLKQRGVQLYAAHLDGKKNYDQISYHASSAFLIGNEAAGLSEEVATMADEYVRIPMCGRVESLNAAVAASLLAYEVFRQRRDR